MASKRLPPLRHTHAAASKNSFREIATRKIGHGGSMPVGEPGGAAGGFTPAGEVAMRKPMPTATAPAAMADFLTIVPEKLLTHTVSGVNLVFGVAHGEIKISIHK